MVLKISITMRILRMLRVIPMLDLRTGLLGNNSSLAPIGREIATLGATWTTFRFELLLSTLAAMTTPCSVKAYGKYLKFLPRCKITFCDLERSSSDDVKPLKRFQFIKVARGPELKLGVNETERGLVG